MEKIPSFTINHLTLMPGVYVSRRDITPGGDVLTTFDVRMTAPNREEALTPRALHTIEHLAATWLRNHPVWADRIVYWGPMGCCTGNYLIVKGKVEPAEIVGPLTEMFDWIACFDGEIPGATPRDCGNYTFNDLDSARKAARKYHEEVLAVITPGRMVYPD